jgi:hypothetical protein
MAQSPKGDFESGFCQEAHHRRDSRELATPGAFLHLTRDQLRCHLPPACFPASATHIKPVSNMGGEAQRTRHLTHHS